MPPFLSTIKKYYDISFVLRTKNDSVFLSQTARLVQPLLRFCVRTTKHVIKQDDRRLYYGMNHASLMYSLLARKKVKWKGRINVRTVHNSQILLYSNARICTVTSKTEHRCRILIGEYFVEYLCVKCKISTWHRHLILMFIVHFVI